MTTDLDPGISDSSPEHEAADVDASGLVVVGARVGPRAYLLASWERRDFALAAAFAEVRARHVDSILGNVWHLLNPMLLSGVYFLIFGIVFGGRDAHDNYIAFLVIGVFTFDYLRKSTTSGARSIVNNVTIMQSIYFPRLLLPVSAVFAETLAHAAAVVVMVGVVFATGEPLTWWFLLGVPAVALQLLFNLGLAMIAARSSTHFRDVEQLLPFVMRLWFYMSGVLYTLDLIERRLGSEARTVFELNPAHVYIRLLRDAFLDQTASPAAWGVAAAWAVIVLTAGFMWFRRREIEYGLG